MARESDGLPPPLQQPQEKVLPGRPPRYPLPFPPPVFGALLQKPDLKRGARSRTPCMGTEFAGSRMHRARCRARRSIQTGGHIGLHNEWPWGGLPWGPSRVSAFFVPSSRPRSRHKGN